MKYFRILVTPLVGYTILVAAAPTPSSLSFAHGTEATVAASPPPTSQFSSWCNGLRGRICGPKKPVAPPGPQRTVSPTQELATPLSRAPGAKASPEEHYNFANDMYPRLTGQIKTSMETNAIFMRNRGVSVPYPPQEIRPPSLKAIRKKPTAYTDAIKKWVEWFMKVESLMQDNPELYGS